MHIAAQFLLVPKLWRSHMPLSLYCYALIIIATWWHHCWREGPIKLELQRARPLINYYTNRCSIWQQDMAGPRAQGSPTRWAHPSRTRHMVAAVAARVGPTSQWLQRDGSAQLSFSVRTSCCCADVAALGRTAPLLHGSQGRNGACTLLSLCTRVCASDSINANGNIISSN